MNRQCTARSSRTGARCKRPPILGGTVCATHGGSAPQVKAAAKDRIAALADRALDDIIGRLVGQAANASEVDALMVRVAHDLLDRAGYGAPTKVEAGPSLFELLAQIEDRAAASADRKQGRPAKPAARVETEGDAVVL